jgi:hypothetical protein
MEGDAVARWRVFLSHTSELRSFPAAGPYINALRDGVSAEGHVIVEMGQFAAADTAPADLCATKVNSCDVYIGTLGTRYGTPVRDRPDLSYTELEFEAATHAGSGSADLRPRPRRRRRRDSGAELDRLRVWFSAGGVPRSGDGDGEADRAGVSQPGPVEELG